MSSTFKEENLIDLLPLYYKRLFPYMPFYKWLSYGNNSAFSKRELSFTLFGDVYIRFQSFDNVSEFVNQLKKLYPIKIDIGAIYLTKPRERSLAESVVPLERELVFDIDLTDYDDVRTCCSSANVCPKCWKFMVIACKILDRSLREDFGFKNILWVFSGRRGVHCWVCDEAARILDDAGRLAIAEYYFVLRGSVQKKRVHLPWNELSTFLKRSLKCIDNYFLKDIVIGQDILGTKKRLDFFFSMMSDDIASNFKPMEKLQSSEERWKFFNETYEALLKKNSIPKNARHLREEIKLYYAYPRLDINVTTSMKHLLKAPFCIHPKSGKVSVPFNPKLIENFDVNNVPTVNLLIDEINAYDKKTAEQEKSLMDTNSNDQKPAEQEKSLMETNSNDQNPAEQEKSLMDTNSSDQKLAEQEKSLMETNSNDQKPAEQEKSLINTNSNATQKNKIKDYKKTSLLKAVTIFEEFIRGLKQSERKKIIEKSDPLDF